MNIRRCSMAIGLLGISSFGAVLAHDHEDHSQHVESAATSRAAETSEVSFADVELIDQDGQTVHLNPDLMGDRIVVMGFIYTSCNTVCPVVSSIMGKVQAQLGERVGSDVQLISISVDPQTDTPERLQEYARHYQKGPGWSWLTGQPQAITSTLKGLGNWSADYANHPPVIMIGKGDSNSWSRYYGFTDPAVLVAQVEALSGAAEHAHGSHLAGARP